MASAAVYHKLVEDHYESLYRFAYRLSGTENDARDLVQETYRRAFEAINQLRDKAAARSWLFKILLNCYRQRRRQDMLVSYCSPEDLYDREDQRHKGSEGQTDEEYYDIEPQRLQQAIEELDEVFRIPLLLFYMEEFSYRDIADQLGIPLGTVMSRLNRAREHLRRRLLTRSENQRVH
jgi:RNA polymerase sigma-70 factor (ECF subfamily)